MQIKIDQELLSKVNQCLKYNQSQFNTINELTEYLFTQYVNFHNNGDDLYELIESYNDTHKEIDNLSDIEDEELDITYGDDDIYEDYL